MRIIVDGQPLASSPEIQRRVLEFFHALDLDPWQPHRLRVECAAGKVVQIEIVDGVMGNR